jgi:hypothetical protein
MRPQVGDSKRQTINSSAETLATCGISKLVKIGAPT